MADSVDLSGVVAAILRSYDEALSAYRRQATGDPAGLRGAARACQGHADRVAGAGSELGDRTKALAADWSGGAADAYRRSADATGSGLAGAETLLRRQAGALGSAADSLESAATALDRLRGDFADRARSLCANASAVPAGQVNDVVSAARSLGESARSDATGITGRLEGDLAALAGRLSVPVGYGATESGMVT